MRVLSLFSGIGGLDLGLERAGMRVVRQCEIDPYCRRVLAKHWPDVTCHDDVTTMAFTEGEADVVCGGFPCQDVSNAGLRAGISGERSGLYRELVRAIRVVRPLYAVLENVAALLGRGMGTVLGDLAESGHDAEWDCIPACAVGAPHLRDRVFVVAHAQRRGLEGGIFGRAKPPAIELAQINRTSVGTRFGETWEAEPNEGWLDDGIPGWLAEYQSRSLGNAVVPAVAEVVGRAVMAQHTGAAHGTD